MDGWIRQEEELASRRSVPQQMEEQIETKPDFKAKKAVDFSTAFCIYTALKLNSSDVGFGSPFRIMRTLLHGNPSS